jgi:hypothetical protein
MRNRTETEQEPLLIDRAAAAEIPSEDAVREWAHGRRAFVSSVMSELGDERRAAADGVRAVGGTPVMFEQFGGRDADPEDAYLAEVETSDIYVGILGRRYGQPLPSRFSPTHAEYLHAEKRGLRIAAWCLKANDREGHEESFLNEIRTFHVVPDFRTPDDLRIQVEDRLKRSRLRIWRRGASSEISSSAQRRWATMATSCVSSPECAATMSPMPLRQCGVGTSIVEARVASHGLGAAGWCALLRWTPQRRRHDRGLCACGSKGVRAGAIPWRRCPCQATARTT